MKISFSLIFQCGAELELELELEQEQELRFSSDKTKGGKQRLLFLKSHFLPTQAVPWRFNHHEELGLLDQCKE